MASLSSLVKCLWVRPGAYPGVEHLKSTSPGYAQTLLENSTLDRKGLPVTNVYFSLFKNS
jgi:hypothetical protein